MDINNKVFTKENVFIETLKYFKGDILATNVWINKYALKNSLGEILELTPDSMHWRLANEIARIERKYPNPLSAQELFDLFKNFKYIVPQGSPMAGIGNNFVLTSISNCFVIGSPIDSYGGIMKADQEQVQLMKRRGGVGQDLSNLRAKGILANGIILKGDTGMPLYMNRFSNSTREVAQDARRGALMLSTSIKHPDSETFIDMKMDTSKVTGANVSVRIDDEFMESVQNGESYTQQFPINSNNPILVQQIDAKKLWKKIIHNAWKSAEPGVLFWDQILRESPFKGYGKEWEEKSTNPCGEIPLCPYDSCRLVAMNLYSYVIKPFTKEAYFDFKLWDKHVQIAQRIMDDIVDLEIEKIEKILIKIHNDPEPYEIKSVEINLWENIKRKAIEGRRTGLGITAEGDMLAALGLRYGTKEATDFVISVHKQMAVSAYTSSIEMAKERGCFPIWNLDKDIESDFLKRIYNNLSKENRDDWDLNGRRNGACLTIAPTGTTSMMTQTTSGIEPCFLPYYTRRRKTDDKSKAVFTDEIGDMWEEFNVFHHKFIDWYYNSEFNIQNNKKFLNRDECKDWLENKSQEKLNYIFENSPYYKATSNDVDYLEKVRMQGEIQKWVDHSISVTVNMPSTVTEEMVDEVYTTAWKSGCKGVTIYRDGSRSGVLISNKSKEEKEDEIHYRKAPKRPEILPVDIYTKTALKKAWTVVIGLLKGKPYEIFAFEQLANIDFPHDIVKGKLKRIGKSTYQLIGVKDNKEYVIKNIISLISQDESLQTKHYSRSLRYGEPIEEITSDIALTSNVTSFHKIVERTLKHYIKDGVTEDACPNCGSKLFYESGCKICKNEECGWSACG